MGELKKKAVFYCCKKYDYEHLHGDTKRVDSLIESALGCDVIGRYFDYSECEYFYRRYMMQCLLNDLLCFNVLVISDFEWISKCEIERKVFAATLALFDAKVVQINGMNTLESDPEYEVFVKNKIDEFREKDPVSVEKYYSYVGSEVFVGNVVRGMISACEELKN